MAVKIITDSTSDITPAQGKALGITIIPLTVNFGPKEYTDGVDITAEEFYARLRVATELPKTSLINVATCFDTFSKFHDDDELVCIFISSDLSGSFQSANVAKGMLEHKKIILVDSRMVAFGLAALVHIAIGLRDAGYSAQGIADRINELKNKLVLHAVIDDLKYLKMGGRLSGTSAALGTVLHLKPIISVAEGKVTVVHKAFGMIRAFDWMVEQYKETEVDLTLPRYFGHSDAPEVLEKFAKFVNKRIDLPADHVMPIGITVGTHAGPGAVGFCYFKK